MTQTLKALTVALCCGALGCNVSTNTGSKFAKTQEVKASNGGTVAVGSSDDPTLAGVKLLIPPNSLAVDTLITVAEGNSISLPDGALSAGPVADLGPNDATFARPVTVVLPFALPAGKSTADLAIQGVDAKGKTVHVSNGDLKIDSAAHTVAFTAVHLHRYSAIAISANAICASGESFCGCCGNGYCQPAGEVCPQTCAAFCISDGGTGGGAGGGGGGGGSCCPAGESWCGCGNNGQCIPDGQACPLACPAPGDPTTGNGTVPPSASPVCCGPGTYLCGCGGIGQCIPDDQACPLLCPVCDPSTTPSPCGCLPPGAVCGCGPNAATSVACQCDPTTSSNGSTTTCAVDAGNPCPDATEHLTACGCLPPGAICAPPPDGGNTGCPSTQDHLCCDGQCVGPNQACPAICFADGGTKPVDGGTCPPNTAHCPNSTMCVTAGTVCP